MSLNPTALPEQFQTKITVAPNGCWLWTAYKDSLGYGYVRYQQRTKPAYRITYQLLVGPIPKGLELDHLCRVHECVNPEHLEPVTHRENCRRGIAPEVNRARQMAVTHCPRGHPYDEANTSWHKKNRTCRTCHRERQRLYVERKRQETNHV